MQLLRYTKQRVNLPDYFLTAECTQCVPADGNSPGRRARRSRYEKTLERSPRAGQVPAQPDLCSQYAFSRAGVRGLPDHDHDQHRLRHRRGRPHGEPYDGKPPRPDPAKRRPGALAAGDPGLGEISGHYVQVDTTKSFRVTLTADGETPGIRGGQRNNRQRAAPRQRHRIRRQRPAGPARRKIARGWGRGRPPAGGI